MKRRNFLANLGGLGIATLVDDIKLLGQTVFDSPNYTIQQFEDKGRAIRRKIIQLPDYNSHTE